MDDVPAGPASPELRRPSLSVVVPVRNGGRDFERCLLRLRDSCLTDYELIVIDDGSTDNSADLAARAGATVFRHPTPLGPAAARNWGRASPSAPLIFFLDADVAVHPPTLGLALARFEIDRGLSALFGSYDASPAAPGSSASIATCSIISCTSRGRSRKVSGRRTRFGPAAESSAATSSSLLAGLTRVFIPGRPSKTSSSVTA